MNEERNKIAQFLAAKGATKCPPAFADGSVANVDIVDLALNSQTVAVDDFAVRRSQYAAAMDPALLARLFEHERSDRASKMTDTDQHEPAEPALTD